jgi:hypothetical protein
MDVTPDPLPDPLPLSPLPVLTGERVLLREAREADCIGGTSLRVDAGQHRAEYAA